MSEHVVTEWVLDVNINNDNLCIIVANSIVQMHVKGKASGDYQMITPSLL